MDNQFARRNLDTVTRMELAEKLEPLEREAALERQRKAGEEHGRGQEPKVPPNLAEPITDEAAGESREKVASKAGVGRETYRKYKYVKRAGRADLLEQVRNKEVDMSLDRAYRLVRVIQLRIATR